MPSGRQLLNMLTEAAHFVENQQQNSNHGNTEPALLTDSPVKVTHSEVKLVQNGNTEHNGDRPNSTTERKEISQYERNKQENFRSDSSRDELNTTKPRTSMGMYGVSEVNSADESNTAMPQYGHLNNGILSRLCPENKHSYRGERPPGSPPKSPDRKRSSPVRSEAESDHQVRGMILPQQMLPGALGQPITHIPTPNPLMPFVHPSLMYPTFDPTLCAADALTRQAMGISSDASRLHSPASSPSTSSSSGAIPATAQGLQGLMYPLTNPALLMGPRGAAAAAQGIGLSDMSMLFPPQLAVYGATANLLPQHIAAWASLAEPDKRMFEGLPGLTAQSVPAHLLTHPYFKTFGSPGLETTLNKEATRTLPKPAPVGGVGLAGGQYTADFWIKYNEALHNEGLKLEGISASQSSPGTRHSLSPENSKKTSMSAHALPPAFHYVNNPVSSLTKSPVPDRKVSSPSIHSLKNGTNPHAHHDVRAANQHSAYGDGNEAHVNGDEARRLMAFAQRQRNPQLDPYAAQNKVGQDRQSPSPRTDRWEHRRTSREFSPYHQSTVAGEKSAKKRSHEQYGIPRDLIPDRKVRSPGLQQSVGGMRLSKSPQRRQSGSPAERLPQSTVGGNPFAALSAKTNVGLADKDDPAYFAQASPYMFHPALGGLAVPPFALPGAYPTTSKAVADAIAASSLGSVAGSQLFRPPVTSEAMAEYARLAGISPYAYALLMPQQQQQQFRPPVAASIATSSQDYMAARKQALHQSALLDGRDKERLASPSHPVMRPYLPNPASAGSKMARGSPIPNHHKPPPKRSPLAPTYNVSSRTPPVHLDGVDTRIKQELSPSPGKRSLPPTSASHARPATSLMRRPEDERRLKRRAVDEEHDRMSSKDVSMKRKREVNEDSNAGTIEDHFRRSLGDKYKENKDTPNKVKITGLVNDHFQKALGDIWSAYNSNNKSSSPDSNGRDSAHRISSAQIPPHLSPHYHPAYLQQPQLPTEPRPQHPYTAQPIRNLPGGKSAKARGAGYSEPTPEVSTAPGPPLNRSSVPSNGRLDPGDGHGHGNDSQYPPSYDSVAKQTNGSLMDPVSSGRSHQSSTSPKSELPTKKFSHPQSSSPRSMTPPGGQDKPLSLSLSNSSLHSHASLTSHLPPYNPSPPVTGSFIRSPSGPPPAYSPHSSASSSSLPPPSSPRRGSVDGRPGADAGVTVPMSVQT